MAHSEAELANMSVTARIPGFWQDSAKLWFVQFESVLAGNKHADTQLFQLVIGKLSKEEIRQAADILENPPESAKYQTLKSRLISVYEKSNESKILSLLNNIELGDSTPSQLLRRMRELANKQLNDSCLKVVWEQKLPAAARPVLAACTTTNLEERAVIADRVIESIPHGEINEVRTTTADRIGTLEIQINRICEMLDKRESIRDARPRRRERSQSRKRYSRSNSTPRLVDGKCWYHRKYKDEARKCTKGCTYQQKN